MLELLMLIGIFIAFLVGVLGFVVVSGIGLLFSGGLLPLLFFVIFFGAVEYFKAKHGDKKISDIKEDAKDMTLNTLQHYKDVETRVKNYKEEKRQKQEEENVVQEDTYYNDNKDTSGLLVVHNPDSEDDSEYDLVEDNHYDDYRYEEEHYLPWDEGEDNLYGLEQDIEPMDDFFMDDF